MQLDEFFNYKNQLINDLMTSEQIVRLLNDSEEVRCDPEQLVYSQVFPYEYVPDTVAHGQTFICCDVDIQRVESKTFLRPTLYIWVFTHKSKMRLPEGGVRVDKLCAEIAKKNQWQQVLWSGRTGVHVLPAVRSYNGLPGQSAHIPGQRLQSVIAQRKVCSIE